jgi:ribose 5-phosphate isomerase A
VVAAAAQRFVIIVSSDKLVEKLSPPVPLELMAFGIRSSLRALGQVRIRPETPLSPDMGVIADWLSPFDDPAALCARLDAVPGVIGHGLFPPALTSEVLAGGSLS